MYNSKQKRMSAFKRFGGTRGVEGKEVERPLHVLEELKGKRERGKAWREGWSYNRKPSVGEEVRGRRGGAETQEAKEVNENMQPENAQHTKQSNKDKASNYPAELTCHSKLNKDKRHL